MTRNQPEEEAKGDGKGVGRYKGGAQSETAGSKSEESEGPSYQDVSS